jgi:hypothetical protein
VRGDMRPLVGKRRDRLARDVRRRVPGLSALVRAGVLAAVVLIAACGDRCQTLCDDVANRVQRCHGDIPWSDLENSPSGKREFLTDCQQQWDEVSADLGPREVQLALDQCAQSRDTLSDLSCDEVMALYVVP